MTTYDELNRNRTFTIIQDCYTDKWTIIAAKLITPGEYTIVYYTGNTKLEAIQAYYELH